MPLITAPYLSRTVGAEGVGTYAYYYAIAHYFYLFGKLGLNNYGTREIATVKDDSHKINQTFTSIFLQQIFVGLFVVIMYLIFSLHSISNHGFIPLILGLYTIGCLVDIDWLYLGIERFDKIAIKNIIVKIITLIMIFVFVKTSSDLWKYALIMSLGMLIGLITLWIGVKDNIKFEKVEFKSIFKHIKPNFILLFPVLAANIYHSLDKVMVGKINNMIELGYYENAEKIVYAISGFITAFDNIMMPKCTNLISKNNKQSCRKYISYTMEFLFFIILMMASVIFGLSKNVVLIVFGIEFSRSIILLQILLSSLIFMIWSDVIRSLWVIPNKKDKIFLITITSGAIIDFILNLILIPKYGAVGACIATVIAEFSVPLVQFIYFKKDINYLKLIIDQSVFIISSIITIISMLAIQQYFSLTILNLILLLIIGCIIYITVCVILYIIFKKEEEKKIRDVILKKIKVITSKKGSKI